VSPTTHSATFAISLPPSLSRAARVSGLEFTAQGEPPATFSTIAGHYTDFAHSLFLLARLKLRVRVLGVKGSGTEKGLGEGEVE